MIAVTGSRHEPFLILSFPWFCFSSTPSFRRCQVKTYNFIFLSLPPPFFFLTIIAITRSRKAHVCSSSSARFLPLRTLCRTLEGNVRVLEADHLPAYPAVNDQRGHRFGTVPSLALERVRQDENAGVVRLCAASPSASIPLRACTGRQSTAEGNGHPRERSYRFRPVSDCVRL